ncbi:MAG: serine/threonine-protein kinase [Polyangiales bacterium]
MVPSRVSPYAAGQRVDDRYFLDALIGRGGTAEVYRARDEKLGRHVALKHALPPRDGRDGREGRDGYVARAERRRLLLEREYHTLAQLAHPRIIEVYDYGVNADGAYYTMELLEGDDLTGGGPWPWQQACALLVDVASSLSILHSRGLLHRDVSAGNVRRGRDGRAKLLDFGALSSIGVALEVVGTPPYVAPEALQMQVLDARADLFALGALAYYLLAGRHAFNARKLSDLRDVWRSPPLALSRTAPDLPPALVGLVTQLLSLDRMARPPSAAEVMRRLCVIAGLPMAEDVAVSRAYLTMPVLVGREALQIASRKTLLALTQGQGATFLIEGAAGSGRTRALDACVLDGRLLGVYVARADASLGPADWTVARSLCAQLFDSLPAQASMVARPLLPWFGPLLSELRVDAVGTDGWPSRNALIRGLRDFVLALGERERLLLAVDDIDRIDEPSLAFLAALAAHVETRSVVLAMTTRHDADSPVPISIAFVRERGQRVELPPLRAEHTEALLRSVFGELSQTPSLAERVHALAHGNPRDTLELAEHLVEAGLARYEAGTWSLPAQLAENDLPRSMASSLRERVGERSEDARELLELSALGESNALTFQHYERLCPGWPRARLFTALSELVSARLLLNVADHYSLGQQALVPVVRDGLAPERARALHARWADALQPADADALVRARHMALAERYAEAIELLLTLDLRTRHPNIELLERLITEAHKLGLPTRKLRELHLGMLSASVMALDVPRFAEWGPKVTSELVHDSGLGLYQQGSDQLPDAKRLEYALRLTHRRHVFTPERARGWSAQEATAHLMRLSNAYSVIALRTFDPSLVTTFPALAPLAPISPTVRLMRDMLSAAQSWLTGRLEDALWTYAAMLERLGHEDAAGLERVQHALVSNLCHLLLGVLKATHGIRDTEVHAQALEPSLLFRANAWRIRQIFHLSHGNQLEASSCGRRADLLRLQQGAPHVASVGTEAAELFASTRIGDLIAVRAALARVEPLATRHPGWVPVQLYGEAEYAGLQEDWASALTCADRGLALGAVGQHQCFSMLAAVRVRALCGLGRIAEATQAGISYAAECQRAQAVPAPQLIAALARALSREGRHAEAFDHLERATSETVALGMTGSMPGYLYESAAYVALAARDTQRFDSAFAACALEYKKGHNPLLGSRLARLFETAQREGMRIAHLAGLLDEGGFHVDVGAEQQLLRDRFGECVDRADRAHCALSLVLSQGERTAGYLFAAASDGLVLLGGIPSDRASEELYTWVQNWFARLPATASEQVTETLDEVTQGESSAEPQPEPDASEPDDSVPANLVTADGRELEPIPLVQTHDVRAILGVIVLEVGRGTRLMPTRHLLGRIADILRAYGDVPA